MVGVSEEDRREEGEWFEDVGLDDRNADVTEDDIDEVGQTNEKGGSE